MKLDGEKVLEAVIKGKINGTKQVLSELGDKISPNAKMAFQLLVDELEDALRVSIEIRSSQNN